MQLPLEKQVFHQHLTMRMKMIIIDLLHNIFEVPITPPVIVTKCCKLILGCKSCVTLGIAGQKPQLKFAQDAGQKEDLD